jgi:hypothetical protein
MSYKLNVKITYLLDRDGHFLTYREMGKEWENFQGRNFKVLGKMPIVMGVLGSKILPEILGGSKRSLKKIYIYIYIYWVPIP